MNSVNSAFKMKSLVGTFALDFKCDFFYAAHTGAVFTEDFHFPLTALSVALVHAEYLGGEEAGLISSGTCTNFDNGIGEFIREVTNRKSA